MCITTFIYRYLERLDQKHPAKLVNKIKNTLFASTAFLKHTDND
jgi:hypothetical protein